MNEDEKSGFPDENARFAPADHEVVAWHNPPPLGDPVREPGSDDLVNEKLIGWLTTVLRFTRPDGSLVFGPGGKAPERLIELARRVRLTGDLALGRLVGWWGRSSVFNEEPAKAGLPLATELGLDRLLAILRPDWTPRGDLVAVDHRATGSTTMIEVAGRGVRWLGPAWTAPLLGPAATSARVTYAATGPFAGAFEWSFRTGPTTITRTAVLIRGAGLALLLHTEEGVFNPVGEVRWSLPAGIEARPDATTRALILSSGRGRPQARLIALGLPESNDPTELGSLNAEGNEIVLRQTTTGPNRCLPLLVVWNKRAPRRWRTLTVAEKSATCPPGIAFAARVGWGSNQNGLLIYRSLGPGDLRSVLGHQTRARLLIAAFSPTGEVHPWVKANSTHQG